MSAIKPSVAEKFAEHIPYHRPLADIERIAAEMGSSPTDDGVVEMIVCRPAIDERRVLEEGVLDTSDGLRGDRWAARLTGGPDGRPDPLRQITVMNSRVLASIAGHRDRWQLAGDQLIVDLDLSIDSLPPGTRLQIGNAVVEVTEPPHTGCAKFAGRFGADALVWANAASDGSSGGAACTCACSSRAPCAWATPSASLREAISVYSKDPMGISPAGSYLLITTPVVETLLSTSFNPEGIVPSANRRLPEPMTTGKIHSRYSSTRLLRNSV